MMMNSKPCPLTFFLGFFSGGVFVFRGAGVARGGEWFCVVNRGCVKGKQFSMQQSAKFDRTNL